MVLKPSTLAPRGAELANGPSLRDLFGGIAGDKYDKKTNPTGFVNIGTAENYIMIPEISKFTEEHKVGSSLSELTTPG